MSPTDELFKHMTFLNSCLWKYAKVDRIIDIEKPLKFGDSRGFSRKILGRE
jgi:hypothetical protein